MATRWPTLAVFFAAALGFVFASFSTSDFAEHLDRQVHGIHCSFIPGLDSQDVSGTSGCHVTMMSPYSSVLRKSIWGGIPISLPAMSVFGFIAFFALYLFLVRKERDSRATGFLALATVLPVLASAVMGFISFRTLGTACKLCIGIYVASFLSFVFALLQWRKALREPSTGDADRTIRDRVHPDDRDFDQAFSKPATESSTSIPFLAAAFGLGVVAVIIPAVVYASIAPDYVSVVKSCPTLTQPNLAAELRIPLGGHPGATPAIELLDPLCPSCRAFESRLAASDLNERIDRVGVLFPLDTQCNWMLSQDIHPGACMMSEAVACAGSSAPQVLAWAFENQDAIRETAKRSPQEAKRMVTSKFPNLAACIGSASARSKINRSLRWVVANQLPVLTPQFFVNGHKVCDEDTDLGLEYALSKLLEGGAQ